MSSSKQLYLTRTKRQIAQDYKGVFEASHVLMKFHENIGTIHAECLKQVAMEAEVYEEEIAKFDFKGLTQVDKEEQERLRKVEDLKAQLAKLEKGKSPEKHKVQFQVRTIYSSEASDGQSANKDEADEMTSVKEHFDRLNSVKGKVWSSKEKVYNWKKSWITLHNSLKGYKKANGRTSTEARLLAQKLYKTTFLQHKKMTKEYLSHIYKTKAPELKGTFNPKEYEKNAFVAISERELEGSQRTDISTDSAESNRAPDAVKCAQNTTAGTRCSNNALQGKNFCRQHYKQMKRRRT